ncbi:hypothetical protein [Stackebrandtia nassauensis]|uniref:hypothetical protein n=1 Tax=Stackebrandtia nassauensis TaxID=283811 RepID=UPI0001A3A669|nr:hypothetical protein [Stackebrandtia nassauensis]
MTDPEIELIRRARGGDTLAMAELLDRLGPYVARVCGPSRCGWCGGPRGALARLERELG